MIQNKGNNGIRLTTRAIYGYKKSPEDKRVWIIDESAAEVVRKIFALFLAGYGVQKIANILESEKILCPSAYFEYKVNNSCTNINPYIWAGATILKMLSKQEYCGDTIHYIREKVLTELVLAEIQRLLLLMNTDPKGFKAMVRKKLSKEYELDDISVRNKLTKAQERIAEIDNYIQSLFEEKVRGNITQDIFASLSRKYSDEKTELNLEVEKLLRAESTQKDLVKRTNNFCSIVENFPEVSEMTPEVVSIFINKVLVHEGKKTPRKRKKTPKIKFIFNGIGELD